jgi:hypothetical protein
MYREGKKFTYSGAISESFMFLKFILSLSLVLKLFPDLLYINFLFYAVISCSHGSCFQNKKAACPTFCSVYIRRYILIHCIIMRYSYTPLITFKLLVGTLLLQFLPSAIKLHVLVQHTIFHSYNKSQQDTLFLKFILIKNSTCFGHLLYIRSPNTV